MALTKLTTDLDIVAALDDEPNDVGGLTAAQLKTKFDEAGNTIKTYVNDTLTAEVDNHIADTENPHSVTKIQVGLGNCNNTADTDKPVSTTQQMALDLKADKTNVLEKDNATEYTPTSNYHPSTKKYTDDNIQSVVLGQIPDGTITAAKLESAFAGTIPEKSKMFYPDNLYGGIITDNLNALGVSGFYTCFGTATGAPNTDSSWYVMHVNSNSGTSYGFQTAKSYDGVGLYYRTKSAGTWGAWGLTPAAQIGVADSGGYFTGTTVEAALQEIANSKAKIEIGSYTGTGTYGDDNPNSLTFSFVPKMVIAQPKSQDTYSAYSRFIALNGMTRVNTGGDASISDYAAYILWDENTFSWYSSSASGQMNVSDKEYFYIAIS